jgi:5'-3' exonuclease
MKRVILFDAKYLLYRQHFAHVVLRAGSFPTGGMFGFWKEVIRMHDLWPQHSMVFCWDGQGPSWREETREITGYKENRNATAETLNVHRQEHVLLELLKELGFHSIRVKGLEADDELAAIACGLEREKDVLIYSGDRDMYQLVRSGVRVFSPRKIKKGNKAPDDLILDEKMVRTVMGVAPKQVSELRAMCGDPADNLKGLPGIGPKKSLELFQLGVRPSKSWFEQPAQFRLDTELRKEWPRVQREFGLIQLPNSERFSEEQQALLRSCLEKLNMSVGRRKQANELDTWFKFLGKYEFTELFKVRSKLWSIP